MTRVTSLWLLALVLPLPSIALAQVVKLEELETIALRVHPELAISQAKVRRTRAAIEVAKTLYHPTLSLGVEGSAAPGGQLVRIDDTSGNRYLVQGTRTIGQSGAFAPNIRYSTGVSFQGPIYDFGRTRAGVRAARVQEEAALATTQATSDQIRSSVRHAYLNWLVTYEMHAFAKNRVNEAMERAQRVQIRIQEGARPSSDRSVAEYEEELTKLEATAAEGNLRKAKAELEQTVNAALPKDAHPDVDVLKERDLPTPTQSDSTLRAIELRKKAALATSTMHARWHLPILSGIAEAGARGQKDDLFPTYRIGISLSVPIWDAGYSSANAEAARAEADELAVQARTHRTARQNNRALARIDFENAGERVKVAQRLVSIAETRYQQTQENYEIGAGSLEAIAEARNTLSRAQTEILLAQAARTEARFRLLQ